MSKGNINYKYLRRRKNWFQRNWKPLLAWIILIGVIVAAVSFAVIKINNAGGFGNLFGKKDNSSDIVQETQTQNEEKETKLYGLKIKNLKAKKLIIRFLMMLNFHIILW